VVTLIGPGGQRYTTPATPGHLEMVGGQFMSAIAPDPHQVLIFLRSPKGGEWGIKTAPGSAPITKVENAEDVPPASVKVRVRGHGSKWTLAYNVKHFVPGTKVRFAERGKDSGHVLGTVSKPSGTLRFTPEEALGSARKLYAYLIDSEGAIVRELSVGRYTAPRAFRPARPRKLRIARRGNAALITWGAVPGARSYRVKVRGSDGRLETHLLKGSIHSARIPKALGFESFTATVTAVGGKNRLAGAPATARLQPVKLKRHRARGHRKH
jgi:hypothetical protein